MRQNVHQACNLKNYWINDYEISHVLTLALLGK